MGAKLVQNASYVAAQGTDRNLHLMRHLLGALTHRDPLQHLSLAWRELRQDILARRRHRGPAGCRSNRGPKATPPAPITSKAPVMVSGFWSLRRNPATPIFFACDRTKGSVRQESITIFVWGWQRRITLAASRPLPSGKRMSSRHASGRCAATAAMPSVARVVMATI